METTKLKIRNKNRDFSAVWSSAIKRCQSDVAKVLSGTMLFTSLLSGLPVMAGSSYAAASTTTETSTAITLSDIADSYAKSEIEALVKERVLTGYENGAFAPRQSMTRAEMAKVLTLSTGLAENREAAAPFKDVAPDSWYAGFVGALVQAGITSGTSAESFSPNDSVTREQLVVFFVRALALESAAQKAKAELPFADREQISTWAQPHVALGYKIGFIGGMNGEDGSLLFAPQQKAERQALARLAYTFKTQQAELKEKGMKLDPEASKDAKQEKKDTPASPAVGGGGGFGGPGGGSSTAALAVQSVQAVDNLHVQVKLNRAATEQEIAKGDFAFTPALTVDEAVLNASDKTLVRLKTSSQTKGQSYALSYKGAATSLSFTGVHTIVTSLSSGDYYGVLEINQGSQTPVGPVEGTPAAVIHGKLVLNPGSTGEVKLQNVQADEIEVLSGASNSIYFADTKVKNKLRVNAANQTNPVRIVVEGNTDIADTTVNSGAALESNGGTFGPIKLQPQKDNVEIVLRGEMNSTVTADTNSAGTSIKLEPPKNGGKTSIPSFEVKGGNISLNSSEGVKLLSFVVSSKSAVVSLLGSGTIEEMKVAKEAADVKLNIGDGAKIGNLKLEADVTLDGSADTIAAIPTEVDKNAKVNASNNVKDKLRQELLGAIDALPVHTQLAVYSDDADHQIWKARLKLDLYEALKDVGQIESSYKQKLQQLEQAIRKLGLAAASDKLKIGYAAGNSAQMVNQSITLPAKGIANTTISWTSSHPSIVAPNGQVTLPAPGSADVIVQLTATIQKHDVSTTRSFDIRVVPTPVGAVDWIDSVGLLQEERYSTSHVTLSGVQISFRGSSKVTPMSVPNEPVQFLREDQAYYVQLVRQADGGIIRMTRLKTYSDNKYEVVGHKELAKLGADYELQVIRLADQSIISQHAFTVGLKPKRVDAMDLDTEPGIDGRDFTVAWKPSVWTEASKQEIYILPYGVKVDPSQHHPVAVFTDNTTGKWQGSADTKDSTGKGLKYEPYQITVTAVSESGQRHMQGVFFHPDLQQAMEPTVTGVVYTDGGILYGLVPSSYLWNGGSGGGYSGGAIPPVQSDASEGYGDYPYRSIVLKNKEGLTVGEGEVEYDGRYRASTYAHETFSADDTLYVYYKPNSSFNYSQPVAVKVRPITEERVTASTVVFEVFDSEYVVTGLSEPHARVEVTTLSGHLLGYADARYDRYFEVWLGDLPEQVIVAADAYGKSPAAPKTVTVLPSPRTATPTVTSLVYEASTRVWVTTEPGNSIEITDNRGRFLAYSYIYSSGPAPVELIPGIQLVAGDQLFVTARRQNHKWSVPAVVTVLSSPASAAPTVTGLVYADGGVLTVTTAPYAHVMLQDHSGTNLHTTQANGVGLTSVTVTSDMVDRLSMLTELYVLARTPDHGDSERVKVTIQPIAGATKTPTVTSNVYELTPQLTGLAEPWSKITVTRVKTGSMASATANLQGSFSLHPEWLDLSAGEALKVTADTFGRTESSPVMLTVLASPKTSTPTVYGAVYEESKDLWGYTEPYSQILLQREDGTLLHSVQTYSNGYFSIHQYNNSLSLTAGEKLSLTARASSKVKSDPVTIMVKASPLTQTPQVVTGSVYTDGGALRVQYESSATLELTRSNGTLVPFSLEYNYYPTYDYSLTVNLTHASQLMEGAVLKLTAKAWGYKKSTPVTLTVYKVQGITAVPTVTSTVYELNGVLSGRTEPGATVRLMAAPQYSQTVYASAYDGQFSFNLYDEFKAGDILTLTADAFGKTESAPTPVTVKAAPLTATPTVIGAVYTDGGLLAVKLEPNASVDVKRSNGDSVSYSLDYSYGTLHTHVLKIYSDSTFIEGDTLVVTARVTGKHNSLPVTLTIMKVQGTTATPTVTGTVYEHGGGYLSGYAEPGASVRLHRADGSNSTTVASSTNGFYYFYVYGTNTAGQVWTITADVIGKLESAPVSVTIMASPRATAPTVTGWIYTDGGQLTGIAIPNATIYLKRADNDNVRTTYTNMYGQYSLTVWKSDLYGMKAGDKLYMTVSSSVYKESLPVEITILPITELTATPTVYRSVYDQVYGKSQPSALLTLKRLDGTQLASASASNYDGSFYLYLSNPALLGEQVILQAQALGKLASEPLTLTLQAWPVTPAPTVTEVVYDQWGRYMISGTAEAGTTITAVRTNGLKIGQAFVPSTGMNGTSRFELYVPYKDAVEGETLLLTAKSDLKTVSAVVEVKLPYLQKSAAPTITTVVYNNEHSWFEGYAEPWSHVIMWNAAGEQIDERIADVEYDGYFIFPLPLHTSENNMIYITARSSNQSISDAVYVQLPTTYIVAPTITSVVYENGYWKLSGIGDTYADITLFTTRGNYDTRADSEGQFAFTWVADSSDSNTLITVKARVADAAYSSHDAVVLPAITSNNMLVYSLPSAS
ncbi:immunoglobulin-like domain-containing protein [Paenibacillus sp. YYML68]|uniref:immunoglobulin-like domain-containing protein n=1 Tax=Paenibacillus sp. YYML68 TaxID=2909250 RepID=UPI0024908D30|nr:immunoglobulin-like domain-containing protein [Paenibacillus sp. YYML68]